MTQSELEQRLRAIWEERDETIRAAREKASEATRRVLESFERANAGVPTSPVGF